MSRWLLVAFLAMAGLALAQDNPYGLPPPFKPAESTPDKAVDKKPDTKTEAPVDKSELPPEEDKSDAPKVFSFNPVQSQREVGAGDFYFKKGNYTAAISRYDEATKWNDGNAEAWMRLGEAQEKKGNRKAAREAYQKYLEITPDAKNAKEIKSRLAKLQG